MAGFGMAAHQRLAVDRAFGSNRRGPSCGKAVRAANPVVRDPEICGIGRLVSDHNPPVAVVIVRKISIRASEPD
jgi:hypothetical protein